MNNTNLIGSINNGNEYFYISQHFLINKNPILFIGRNDREIFQINEKLKWFLPDANILIFRSWDQIPYDKVSPSINIQAERIKTLHELNLIKNNNIIVLTTVNAIIQKTVNQEFINNYIITISKNIKIDFKYLIKNLINLGFNRVSIVREKSEFSVRGNIVDLFLTNMNNPIRLDFFDDRIESINEFDAFTQKTFNKININKIYINPSSEILLNEKSIKLFKKNFISNFKDHRKSEYFHSILNNSIIPGIQQFLPFFYNNLSNIFIFCKNFDFILNSDFDNLLETNLENIQDNYYARISGNDPFNIHPSKLYLNNIEILKYFEKNNIYILRNFNIKNGNNFNLKIQPNLSSLKKEIDFKFIKKFFDINLKNHIIIICVKSHGSLDRIKNILFENISINPIEIKSKKEKLKIGYVYITTLNIEHSVIFKNYIYLNEKSIFGYNFTNIKRKSKEKEIFFEEINKYVPGNILVHSEYGFCKFIGIKKIRNR